MVSGTISLPLSGFFSPFLHSTRSLSVSQEYLALPDGPGRFAQNFSCSALLRITICLICVRLRDYHPLWLVFPKIFFSAFQYNDLVLLPRRCVATSPVWAVPRSLATTWGIISLFSLPRGTKMFQFPRLAPQHKLRCTTFSRTGCPIRKSSDQGLFAPSRSLSQLITSFIASVSLGIRHTPFLTFFRQYPSIQCFYTYH